MESKETPDRVGIWWIASYPKSGSTWMRMFINAAVTGYPCDINSAFQYASSDFVQHMYPLTAAMAIEDMSLLDMVYYRLAVLLNHLQISRDVCLKTHHANITMDGIPLCPAKLSKGACYIVRDPRDVAISNAKHMGLSLDDSIKMLAQKEQIIRKDGTYFHYLSSWSRHVESWLDEESAIPTTLIKYEDMMSSPEATFKTALTCLGLEQCLPKLDFAIESSSFEKLKKQEETKGFRETGNKQDTFFNQGKVGHWQTMLTTTQVKQIEDDHREIMTELDYIGTDK